MAVAPATTGPRRPHAGGALAGPGKARASARMCRSRRTRRGPRRHRAHRSRTPHRRPGRHSATPLRSAHTCRAPRPTPSAPDRRSCHPPRAGNQTRFAATATPSIAPSASTPTRWRNHQGDDRGPRCPTHGREVRQIDHQRFPAHVSCRAPAQIEVHSFDDRVGGEEEPILEDRGVVANPLLICGGSWQSSAQPVEERGLPS